MAIETLNFSSQIGCVHALLQNLLMCNVNQVAARLFLLPRLEPTSKQTGSKVVEQYNKQWLTNLQQPETTNNQRIVQ